ncbi:MAG: hypothetical protein ITG04_08490, partial [Proteiniphilum sp.]|nr:hypothetical protein [Proteiniphilum sp.]
MKFIMNVLTLILLGMYILPSYGATWSLPQGAGVLNTPFSSCSYSEATLTVNCPQIGNEIVNGSGHVLRIGTGITLVVQGAWNFSGGLQINPEKNKNITLDLRGGVNVNGSGVKVNANIISSSSLNLGNGVNVNGSVSVTPGGSLQVGVSSTVFGDVDVAGNFTNDGVIDGALRVSGAFTNNGNGKVTGNIVVGGSVSNNGRVEGNIKAEGSVTTNGGSYTGSINAKGTVMNNGEVKSYINAPVIVQQGVVAGRAGVINDPNIICNINQNEGPCGGGGNTVHHYELHYAAQALTCGSLSVSIKACANAACSSTLSTPSTLRLSPNGGWASNPITFTGTTTATLVVRSPGEITLGVGSASPAASSGLVCSTSGCKVMFHDSGFLVDVPDFISGDSTKVTIQAVKADKDDPQKCSPAFDSGTRILSFWSSYQDPGEEQQVGNQSVSIDGTVIGKAYETATPIGIKFIGDATAELSALTYPDAGEMALHVSYSGAGNEGGLSMKTMEGQGGFIVTPAQLKVEARTIDGQPVICSDPEGDFDTDDCRAFVAAGDGFSLHVTALNRVGNETPNFEYDEMNVEVVPTDIHPSGGAAVLSPSKYVHGLNNKNTFPSKPMVNEVGVMKFRATAENYLKDNNQVVGTSDWVGRFFPAWLELGEKPKQSVGCLLPPSETSEVSGFTYQGQTAFLTDKLEVRGFNRSGDQTQNYKGDFWRFLEDSELDYQFYQEFSSPVVDQPSAIAGRVKDMPIFTATPENSAFVPSGDYSFTRPSTPTSLDNPFSLKMVIWNWHDRDGVYFKRDDDQPEDERGFEPTVPMPVVALIGDSEFRLGRVRSENLIVPHGNSAQAPIVLEHWRDTAWQRDVDNGCTLLAPPADSTERVSFDFGLTGADVDEAEEWNQSYLQITDAT